MVPINGVQIINGVVKSPQTWIGKSTESKPENPAYGECILEINTSRILFYDGTEWLEWGASS